MFKTLITIELHQCTHLLLPSGNFEHISSDLQQFSSIFLSVVWECNVSEEEISTVLEMCWNFYDQFKHRAFKIWIVNYQKKKKSGYMAAAFAQFF